MRKTMTVAKRRNKAVETNDNAYAIIETQTHKREAKTLRLRELRMAKEAEDAADRLARTPAAGKGSTRPPKSKG
jgi:hypothetical protein